MDNYVYLFSVFVAMGAVTAIERGLPFAASNWLQKQSWVKSVGNFLPLAVMVLLVLHSSIDAAKHHEGLPVPEVVAIFLTLLLQWFLKNSLLSIFAGTACYVLFLNTLFV